MLEKIQKGAIIVIEKCVASDGQIIGKHSFIVIDDCAGKIRGLDYDMVVNIFSSFKNAEHKGKKLSYRENFFVGPSDVNIKGGNDREGFIKAEQLYYFDSSKIKYTVIGSLDDSILELLLELIADLDADDKLRINTKNLVNHK